MGRKPYNFKFWSCGLEGRYLDLDIKVGSQNGGYDPFFFDINPFLDHDKNQELTVKAWDPTDEGPQPRGKQVKNSEGIYYTPVSGIWQTVWIEPINSKSLEEVRFIADIDNNLVKVSTGGRNTSYGDIIEITVFDGTKEISKLVQ